MPAKSKEAIAKKTGNKRKNDIESARHKLAKPLEKYWIILSADEEGRCGIDEDAREIFQAHTRALLLFAQQLQQQDIAATKEAKLKEIIWC